VRGTDGGTLPPGEPGELYLRGPHIVAGVLRRAGKDAGSDPGRVAQDRDIARIDGDGFVYILDRAKDMINRGGGEDLQPRGGERPLHVPRVAEAAVFGIPHPVFGEVPAARLVRCPARRSDPEKIRAFCRTVSRLQGPVQVGIADRIPRNPGEDIEEGITQRVGESLTGGNPMNERCAVRGKPEEAQARISTWGAAGRKPYDHPALAPHVRSAAATYDLAAAAARRDHDGDVEPRRGEDLRSPTSSGAWTI